jgi:uncharacterized SAM-binding protein YcdF (DUF218 family)
MQKAIKQIIFRQRRKLVITSVFISCIILISVPLIYAGSWLVRKDELSHTDAILILMGSIPDRILEAKDVYQANPVKKILIVNNIQTGSEALKPYGIHIPNSSDIVKQALVQLGIPDSTILILPGRAKSTRNEADTIAIYLRQNPSIRSLTLVSSSAHTRRAIMIFEDSFQDHGIEVGLISAPSKYSEFNAKQWWMDRQSAKQVVEEYVKMMSFLLVEQFVD